MDINHAQANLLVLFQRHITYHYTNEDDGKTLPNVISASKHLAACADERRRLLHSHQ
jgi:hypothetical protein